MVIPAIPFLFYGKLGRLGVKLHEFVTHLSAYGKYRGAGINTYIIREIPPPRIIKQISCQNQNFNFIVINILKIIYFVNFEFQSLDK